MEIKIKDIVQLGLTAGPIDKYIDRKGPFDLDMEPAYQKLEKFLKENAETISPQDIKPFGSHFGEGIITSPSANSLYFLKNCLVENKWIPAIFSGDIMHLIKIAGAAENVDKTAQLIMENLHSQLGYSDGKEKIYNFNGELDFRSINSILDLEKELSTPAEIKRIDNLFEQTKNLERIGERLSGEAEILHDIEDYFRNVEFYPVVRDQIKRILQYVPSVFPEEWKSPESFEKLNEKEKQAYKDIAKNGVKCAPGPIIQKVIELAVEYKDKYKIKQNA